MTDHNIAAYTSRGPESFPQYVSINERGGKIEVTVRGPAVLSDPRPDGVQFPSPGPSAMASFTPEEFADLLRPMKPTEQSILTILKENIRLVARPDFEESETFMVQRGCLEKIAKLIAEG